MSLYSVRSALYVILFLFAIVTLALSAVRIHYTTTIPSYDPTNYGVQFYDPVVVELLVTSCLTILWAPYAVRMINKIERFAHPIAAELIGLFILFVLWLVGAAIATHTSNTPQVSIYWGNLSSCWSHSECRALTAMLAFAWLCWIIVLVLFLVVVQLAIVNKVFHHGGWRRRGLSANAV